MEYVVYYYIGKTPQNKVEGSDKTTIFLKNSGIQPSNHLRSEENKNNCFGHQVEDMERKLQLSKYNVSNPNKNISGSSSFLKTNQNQF